MQENFGENFSRNEIISWINDLLKVVYLSFKILSFLD